MVNAYILIQTEVGKAAQVAKEVPGIDGVADAEDVTGPYDVIVRAEANTVDELGKLVVAQDPGGRRASPDADLPGGPPVAAPGLDDPASPCSSRTRTCLGPLAAVSLDRQVDQALDQIRVATARSPPTASGTSRST